MIEIKAPNEVPHTQGAPIVFLGGSIEMGTADEWQKRAVERLEGLPCIILNPRRDSWNASWEQDISNEPFREQVDWELDGLDRSNVIILNFHPNTRSPITLMELGLYAETKVVRVCCPPGFWRRGNVQIVCERYGIPLYDSFDDLMDDVVQYVIERI